MYSEENKAGRLSAVACLGLALRYYVKMLAPFLPFISEEIWSWRYRQLDSVSSVHCSLWPDAAEFSFVDVQEDIFDLASEVLSSVHQAKSEAQKSLKWPVFLLKVSGDEKSISDLRLVEGDISNSAKIEGEGSRFELITSPNVPNLHTEVVLSDRQRA